MMKKREILIIAGLFFLALTAIIFFHFLNEDNRQVLVVNKEHEVVLSFDPKEDAYYTLSGAYGEFHIEVKDGRWRATQVDCPNHNCEKMGWSSYAMYVPIICLPNELWVIIDD